MINKTEQFRSLSYSALLAFESWIVEWTMLMVSEWGRDRYPEELE